MYDLDNCKICHKPLPDLVKERAHRDIEEKTCSPECRMVDYIRRYACCEKAKPMQCVCAHAFTCPDHGSMHIGTHD